MKKLLVLSGKGGTGKTTVSAALIELLDLKTYADCDVDAPNLHLVVDLQGEPEAKPFHGMDKAWIDPKKCTACGLCARECVFSAIERDKTTGMYQVDPFHCEGCALCGALCPVQAVQMVKDQIGDLNLYRQDKVFSTAQLKTGSGNSGLLVSEVKKELEQNARGNLALIDGSPGIGCPVIASISGVDLVLLVAEPSLSGLTDLQRIIKTGQIFGVKMMLCINRYDENLDKTEALESFAQEQGIEILGRIPYDPLVIKAINTGRSIVQMPGPAQKALQTIAGKLTKEW